MAALTVYLYARLSSRVGVVSLQLLGLDTRGLLRLGGQPFRLPMLLLLLEFFWGGVLGLFLLGCEVFPPPYSGENFLEEGGVLCFVITY